MNKKILTLLLFLFSFSLAGCVEEPKNLIPVEGHGGDNGISCHIHLNHNYYLSNEEFEIKVSVGSAHLDRHEYIEGATTAFVELAESPYYEIIGESGLGLNYYNPSYRVEDVLKHELKQNQVTFRVKFNSIETPCSFFTFRLREGHGEFQHINRSIAFVKNSTGYHVFYKDDNLFITTYNYLNAEYNANRITKEEYRDCEHKILLCEEENSYFIINKSNNQDIYLSPNLKVVIDEYDEATRKQLLELPGIYEDDGDVRSIPIILKYLLQEELITKEQFDQEIKFLETAKYTEYPSYFSWNIEREEISRPFEYDDDVKFYDIIKVKDESDIYNMSQRGRIYY